MLTRIKSFGDINRYCGLSTDTKPIEDVPNMSEFSEIDTSKEYVFDAENQQWHEDVGSGGGGGGAGKQDKITVVGLAKFDGNGGFAEAEEGVDYQSPISWDSVPTEDSTNGITSGAVYAAIGDVEAALDAINDGLEGLM